jgi:hypothetical protein
MQFNQFSQATYSPLNTLKIEAAIFFETFINKYELTQRHMLQDRNLCLI